MRYGTIGAFFAICLSAAAQESSPVFEAASLRLAAEKETPYLSGGPGSNDPGQIAYIGVSLTLVMRTAFARNKYEIAAPAWLGGIKVDIRAKLPAGATQSEFEQMLQNLLIERFKMQVRHETRQIPGYELSTAKGGARLSPAEPFDREVPIGTLIKDRNGVDQLPPGRNARLVIPLAEKRLRMSARMQSPADIVAMCARETGRPVIDRTGLSGLFDFNLDFTRLPDEPSDAAPPDETPFASALASQLGLSLESKKVPVDVLVIDHAEKVPVEN